MGSPRRSFVAGLLVGNSAPHLATAVAGRRHLTPLAGRESGPLVNAVWGAANLVGGLLALAPTRGSGRDRWGGDLVAFELGVVTFAAWMVASETVLRVNHDR